MDKTALGQAGRRRLMRQATAWGLARLAGSAAGPALGLTGCAALRPAGTDAALTEHPRVLPFSSAASSLFSIGNGLPDGWHSYAMRRDLPQTRYALVRDGDRQVLHAHAQSAATGLRCPVRISTQQQPLLDFSWRVQQVPSQATVAAPELDDCPARVIVAFDGDHARLPLRDRLFFDQVELFTGQKLPFAMLMYVWDGHLPTDTVSHNHRSKRIQYLTVDSGAHHIGEWRHHRRDLVADYQRVFGEPPGDVISVGVLTDGDALKLDLQAWYGDITLRPRG